MKKRKSLESMYDGAFEAWKGKLAAGRIKAMRLPRGEWEDVMQDLAIVILQFKYDPAVSNGATEETALFATINRYLLRRMRDYYRTQRGFERYLRQLGIAEDGTYVGPVPFQVNSACGCVDVADAISHLPKADRAILRDIQNGMSWRSIAQKRDCDDKTIAKALNRIREHLERLGYDLEGR